MRILLSAFISSHRCCRRQNYHIHSSLFSGKLFLPAGRIIPPTSLPLPNGPLPSFQHSSHRRSLATMTNASAPPNASPSDYSHPRVEVLSSQIEKPELDDRSYRLIRLLDNKLEVLLVHDPKTDKSSAAMDVHVGHLSDPKDFPGLAHALEHCLFLGSACFRHVG
jgi:insulysin